MDVKTVYENLIKARRPKDFFGEIENVRELHSIYKKICKEIHPDVVGPDDIYYANEAFIILHRLYVQGVTEYDNGVYDAETSDEEYKKTLPIFQVCYGEKRYEFFSRLQTGEVAEIFEGVCDKQPVCIKIPISNDDSHLIENEYETLLKLRHQSLPYAEDKFSINGATCFTMRKIDGIRVEELMRQYPSGVPAEHVLWMVERLLSVVGFLHINNIVHGNIKPDNLIINKHNHNVTLTGFSFAINDANKKSAKYKIKNKHYSADEVGSGAHVEPSTDIYSIGKVAIYLMGGYVENDTMPSSVGAKVQEFIYRMVNKDPKKRPFDAWKLYKELQELRTEIYGAERFKTLR